MSKRINIAVALIGATSLLSGCNFSQPTPGCVVQDGDWQAKYTLKTPEAAGTACGELKGEALGVYKFTDPNKANSSILTIRPEGAAALTRYSYKGTDGKTVAGSRLASGQSASVATAQTAPGGLVDMPDAQSFCAATNFSGGQVDAAAVVNSSTGEELEPATSVHYDFTKVEVYSDPATPGTQLKGELTYTVDGCTAKYEVAAIWPVVGCDPSADPAKDPVATCGEGSGINPDFAVECDKDLEVCVPSKAIPSLK